MKTTCSVQHLRKAFQSLSAVCPSRSPSPILSHLRLVCRDGAFTLSATDLEIWARQSWKQAEAEPVDLLLPAGSVGGLLREIDQDLLEIEVKERGVEIRTADTDVRIPRVSPVEFPAWPDFKCDGSFQVDAQVLVSALRRVAFAAAREKTRYALNGVLVALSGKSVEWVATDGRRLSLVKTESVSSPSGSGKMILGLALAGLAERTFAEVDGGATVSFDKRFCRIEGGGLEILGRQVEGAYPDYRGVIPKSLPEKARVPAADLERAIRKAMLVTSATAGSVGWRLSEGALEVTGQSAEEGEVKVTLKAEYGGQGLQIRFNPRFLLEGLKTAPGTDVSVELKDATSPGQIRFGEDALYVVLPVHLVS